MNRRLSLIAAPLIAAGLLGATPAIASDSRLATRAYNPDEVVRIDGKAGVQAAIAFADNEHIENVAIGDANSWQVTPNKRANLLFVKPLSAAARTNLTVVTDRRSYFFDLVAAPSARPIYVLRFTYPSDPKDSAPQPGNAPPLSEAEQLAVRDVPTDPAMLNFSWAKKGKSALLPSRIYDDGTATYVSWPAGSPVPAILIRDSAGTEGPVNYAVRGDVIVVDGVPGLIVLRSGKDMASLENLAPRPVPVSPPTPPQALAAAATSEQGQ